MYTIDDAMEQAKSLVNDINGNPRYYVPAFIFRNVDTNDFVRPKYCRKYMGKRYGAGWVFTSYSLENDLRDAMAFDQ